MNSVYESIYFSAMKEPYFWRIQKVTNYEGIHCQPRKQSSRGVLGKRYSDNMHQICRRTTMSKRDFIIVANELYWNHTLAWCSPVNLLQTFRTPCTKKNTSGGLFRKPPESMAMVFFRQGLDMFFKI